MLDVLPLPSFVPRIPHCVCTGLERDFESEGAGKDSRLATCERYLPLVRDLKGIETLHQIQKPRVEAEKEKA